MFKDTEYKINVQYAIKDFEVDSDYKIKFSSSLPESGRLIIRLTGTLLETGVFHFSSKTKSVESNPLLFLFTAVDIGDVSSLKIFAVCNLILIFV